MMIVVLFRLGHRYVRDNRTTTHLFLAARALGASCAIYTGKREKEIEETLKKVNESWGGAFSVEHTSNWREALEKYKSKGFEITHLTMYGLPIQQVMEQIRSSSKDKVVVVGGAKVPKEIYNLADWNVAVTSQPHSEVSAFTIFLHELFEGQELSKHFEGGKLEVIPQAKGKRIIKKASFQRKVSRT